jgi:predicted regulator of amino acid metabolism with ACT domain
MIIMAIIALYHILKTSVEHNKVEITLAKVSELKESQANIIAEIKSTIIEEIKEEQRLIKSTRLTIVAAPAIPKSNIKAISDVTAVSAKKEKYPFCPYKPNPNKNKRIIRKKVRGAD